MAVYESKRGMCSRPPASLAAMMIVVAVILINANCGGAAVLVKSNATYGCITGREEECLIAEDMELEYLLTEYSSHVARVLQTTKPNPPKTPGALKGTQIPCKKKSAKGESYDACKPQSKPKPKPKPHCAKYDRGCTH